MDACDAKAQQGECEEMVGIGEDERQMTTRPLVSSRIHARLFAQLPLCDDPAAWDIRASFHLPPTKRPAVS